MLKKLLIATISATLGIASLAIGNTAEADTDEAFPVSFLTQRCAENGEKEMYFRVSTNLPDYEIRVEGSAWTPSPDTLAVKRTDNASFTQYRLAFEIEFRPIGSPDSVKRYRRTATFNIDAMDCAPRGNIARTTICQATGPGRWKATTPDAGSLIREYRQDNGDIIPAFAFDIGDQSIHFGGKNLGPIRVDGVDGPTGQEILNNGCRIPAQPATATTLTTQPDTTQPDTTQPDTTQPDTTQPDTTQPATSGPVPTSAPAAVPPTQPVGVPTTAPIGPSTQPALCPDGEFAHDGSCFPTPPLGVTKAVVPTVTGTGGATLPVPVVECVTQEGGQTVTWFGYRLDASDPVRVERGANNSMSPNGQPPTLFGPGIHLRVISAVSTDGVASWTIGATTVTSDSSTADCDTITDITTTPDTRVPATTDAPDTTQPDTSGPATTQSPEPGGCAAGEREVDGECISVDPVRLVLVDNYLECDGHGVARFAAFNTNGFALGGAGFSSSMSPQRLAGFAPQVIGDEPIASDDGRDLAEFVDVRYVTAVSWTVVHDGIETTISAGVDGARSNPTCPAARAESSGVHGGTGAPTSMAVTGSDVAGHLGIAILFVLTGALLVLITRRKLDDQAVA